MQIPNIYYEFIKLRFAYLKYNLVEINSILGLIVKDQNTKMKKLSNNIIQILSNNFRIFMIFLTEQDMFI